MQSLDDPAPPETLELLRRLGCSYRPRCFFPGPNVSATSYPLEVWPPAGHHFGDGQHSFVIKYWSDIAERLATIPVVPCDADCDER
ncbi:MAG: hypothetical protein IPN03_08600 [Holophagales bacterium]|nr:hypothetical protein [Holophagales bacterium]